MTIERVVQTQLTKRAFVPAPVLMAESHQVALHQISMKIDSQVATVPLIYYYLPSSV